MRHDDDKQNPLNNTLNAVPADETAASAASGPVPVPIPGGDALTDPGMASFAATDASTGGGLGDILKETFVRSTLSPEENALTQDHHIGREVTGRLDEAVDAPDHSVAREKAPLPVRGR